MTQGEAFVQTLEVIALAFAYIFALAFGYWLGVRERKRRAAAPGPPAPTDDPRWSGHHPDEGTKDPRIIAGVDS